MRGFATPREYSLFCVGVCVCGGVFVIFAGRRAPRYLCGKRPERSVYLRMDMIQSTIFSSLSAMK